MAKTDHQTKCQNLENPRIKYSNCKIKCSPNEKKVIAPRCRIKKEIIILRKMMATHKIGMMRMPNQTTLIRIRLWKM